MEKQFSGWIRGKLIITSGIDWGKPHTYPEIIYSNNNYCVTKLSTKPTQYKLFKKDSHNESSEPWFLWEELKSIQPGREYKPHIDKLIKMCHELK